MQQPPTTSRLAIETAQAIYDAFVGFHDAFHSITRRAAQRFHSRDWHGMRNDAKARLQVRASAVEHLLNRIRPLLGERIDDRIVWIAAKAVYSGLINSRQDWEISETFYNSVTRQVFTTIGVDEDIEFVHSDYVIPPVAAIKGVSTEYRAADLPQLMQRVLRGYPDVTLSPSVLKRGAALAADRLRESLQDLDEAAATQEAEFVDRVFYRGERAYLIGRLQIHGDAKGYVPLVLCFHHDNGELTLDALLSTEDDVAALLSYTRSYMHVDVDRPYDLVQFLKSILPRKSRAEIYIAIGYTKHGKTELYRHALRHLAHTTDLYQRAEGQRGMVMVAFTMPSYPVVFKIIRDRFDYPKQCTRQNVIDRYHLVFEHDRAGRLIDAQEYEYLLLDRRRFADELLQELLDVAAQTVSVQGNQVVIRHCYAERRVAPLDIFLRQAAEDEAHAAVIDYGLAIKDLALTNLFPGDLLLKNFGVTRQGKVVFYDYDEVCLLGDCKFRTLPQTGRYEDEIAAEPWFGVAENDIFPEEFVYFLGLNNDLKQTFLAHHADLLRADYWRDLQQQLAAGKIFHVPPYSSDKRLAARDPRRDLVPLLKADQSDAIAHPLANQSS